MKIAASFLQQKPQLTFLVSHTPDEMQGKGMKKVPTEIQTVIVVVVYGLIFYVFCFAVVSILEKIAKMLR